MAYNPSNATWQKIATKTFTDFSSAAATVNIASGGSGVTSITVLIGLNPFKHSLTHERTYRRN